MIAFVRGKIVEAGPARAVVDVHGVGYELLIPVSSFDKLPPAGQETTLLTVLVVREDAHLLFGFATTAERDLFKLLTGTVSGIGPKLALSILSNMTPTAFRGAIAEANVKLLSSISGIGRKTAERLVVELKDKVGAMGAAEASSEQRATAPAEQRVNDAVLTLITLEFKQAEAYTAVRAAQAVLGENATVEELVRGALKKAGS